MSDKESSFDESKDVLVAHVGIVPAGDKGLAITVDVKSYDGGPPRIRLNRTGKKKDGTPYKTKLGGLDEREAVALAALLPAAASALDAASKGEKRETKREKTSKKNGD